MGHLYAISDSFRGRETYPVFDLEWYPAHLIDKEARHIESRILSIRKLAEGAGSFVNACDYDVEGETIGHNILRYACGGKEDVALRAKFSTLTKEELVAAFGEAAVGLGKGLAKAGRARHLLDFVWGINLLGPSQRRSRRHIRGTRLSASGVSRVLRWASWWRGRSRFEASCPHPTGPSQGSSTRMGSDSRRRAPNPSSPRRLMPNW